MQYPASPYTLLANTKTTEHPLLDPAFKDQEAADNKRLGQQSLKPFLYFTPISLSPSQAQDTEEELPHPGPTSKLP